MTVRPYPVLWCLHLFKMAKSDSTRVTIKAKYDEVGVIGLLDLGCSNKLD